MQAKIASHDIVICASCRRSPRHHRGGGIVRVETTSMRPQRVERLEHILSGLQATALILDVEQYTAVVKHAALSGTRA